MIVTKMFQEQAIMKSVSVKIYKYAPWYFNENFLIFLDKKKTFCLNRRMDISSKSDK